jgi:uncharacterized membrane protein
MKTLIVLIGVFVLSLGITKLVQGNFNYSLSGRIGMSAMLLLTASGHFLFPKGMAAMLPGFIPFKGAVVFSTAIIEIAAAVALLISSLQYFTARFLIIFFILILPANIYAATKGINYEKGTPDGPGLNYLWFRIPLQLFFISWVYFFAIWMNK